MTTNETRGEALRVTAKRAVSISVANGFERPSWLNLPGKLMMVVTELYEMTVAQTWDHMAEELADIALRLVGTIDATFETWTPRGAADAQRTLIAEHTPFHRLAGLADNNTPVQLMWQTVGWLSKSIAAWRRGRQLGQVDACICLEYALASVFHMADVLEIDLIAHMRAKCDINHKRPQLHGKVETL